MMTALYPLPTVLLGRFAPYVAPCGRKLIAWKKLIRTVFSRCLGIGE